MSREDDTVTIKLDELVGLFERIDQLESDVAALKERVDAARTDVLQVHQEWWDVPVGDHL